jgi:hypothetical protein
MLSRAPAGETGATPLLWLGVWCVALFTVALMLDTRHNTFPYFYHPDESAKVAQVMTGNWNYHHPMLLLTTTKAVVEMLGVAPREQNIVEAGRWVSAAFTAAAIAALSLLAFVWRGWAAAIAAGLALLLHHQLFELAHYMKEDTALLFGLALTFLTAFLYARQPDIWRAICLGLVTACAISGKYIGVSALAVALPVLWFAPGEGRRAHLMGFFGAMVAALLVINLPLVLHPDTFRQSFDREMEFVVHGQRGTTRSVPHTLYWNVFRDNSTPVIWVLLLVFLAARWRERRSVTLVEWLLIGFPFALALALSFSPKSNDRYFLPATAMLVLLAALGALDAARLLGRWVPLRWATVAVVAALVAAQLPDWARYEAAFQRDDNAELFAWVKTQLPVSAIVAKDSRIQLPDPNNPHDAERFGRLPQKILADRFAADLGSIEGLRALGVTHVAVSESDYGRFFLRGLRPKKGEAEDFARRKAFYEELLRDGELVFERERGTVLYLHPGIRLYRMPPG